MQIRHLLMIFIPAFVLIFLVLFIRIIQYEPLNPAIEAIDASSKTDTSVIPLFPEDPIVGDKKALTSLVLFADFGCDQCKNEYLLFQQMLIEYGAKVKIIWKGLPVTKFPYDSELSHVYAFCANKQKKFATFTDIVFENNFALSEENLKDIAVSSELDIDSLETCLQSSEPREYIEKNKQIARLLNIQSVPTMFLNNKQISNPQTLDEWKTLLSL